MAFRIRNTGSKTINLSNFSREHFEGCIRKAQRMYGEQYADPDSPKIEELENTINAWGKSEWLNSHPHLRRGSGSRYYIQLHQGYGSVRK